MLGGWVEVLKGDYKGCRAFVTGFVGNDLITIDVYHVSGYVRDLRLKLDGVIIKKDYVMVIK